MSRFGKAIVLFTVRYGKVPYKQVSISLLFGMDTKRHLEIWPEDGDLCAALVPVCSNRDSKAK